MLFPDPPVAGADALAELKAFARVESDGEDATLTRLLATALALAESAVGEALVERGFVERLTAGAAWTRLTARPVTAITAVAGADAAALPLTDYAVDLDGDGVGRVRAAAGTRLRVIYRAGRATTWSALPPALRTGVIRMTLQLLAMRDGGDAAVAAPAELRGFRRMRLS